MAATAIRSHAATGAIPWPCVLVEGEEKSGRSWLVAEFSACEQVGQMYWLDLGEGVGDEYGAVPGAGYQVIDHDGSYADIRGQVLAVKEEAARAAEAGEPPVVVVLDPINALWDMLKNWANDRARDSRSGRALLAKDPNAEVPVAQNLWNDATSRWFQVLTPLLTFPGIAVLVANGKEVVEVRDGKPVAGSYTWRVEGQKNLCHGVTAWVRMTRDQPPTLIGARSVHAGRRPGVDRPKPMPGFTLEHLVFDMLQCDPATARVRNLVELSGGAPDLDPEAEQGARGARGPGESARLRRAASTRAQDPLRADLYAEMETQLAVLDVTRDEMAARYLQVLGQPIPEAPTDALRDAVSRMREPVVEALRAAGRSGEADRYARAEAPAASDVLPSRAPAARVNGTPGDGGAQAQSHPGRHPFVWPGEDADDDGRCASCGQFADDEDVHTQTFDGHSGQQDDGGEGGEG